MRFATLTQIAPLRFATSHTPGTLAEIRRLASMKNKKGFYKLKFRIESMKSYIHKLRQSLVKNKKKITLYTLGYFATGYAVTLGLYLLSNLGYFKPCPPIVAPYKCPSVMGLVIDLAVRSDFWLQVLLWPLTLITYFGT
jgi:hypothetical protein